MALLNKLKNYAQRKLGISLLISGQQRIEEQQNHLIKCQHEVLKANLFRDTICDSEWLQYKNFSLGGWAVDYGLMYTLYKVLNNVKPKNVLEFGLGQSSKMLHQYGSYYTDAKVLTCEHNSEWIDFFKVEINGRYQLNIKLLGLQHRNYKGFETLVYEGLDDVRNDQKYDLILVDGPFGSEHYSRSQLIDLVQNNLSERFCVIMDDYERIGEQETVSEIKNILDSKGISYASAIYEASKQHCLICSKDLEFLTSMYWF